MLLILKLVVAIILILWVFRQVRKPSGPLGRHLVRAFNLGHATMTDWGLQQVMVPKNALILDVGCGGGRTVRRLVALAPEGKVVGLDYSAASVAVSRETNAQDIEIGRVLSDRTARGKRNSSTWVKSKPSLLPSPRMAAGWLSAIQPRKPPWTSGPCRST